MAFLMVVSWVLVAGLGWAINWRGARATPFLTYVALDSKWAYVLAYHVDDDQVFVESEPSDCDFLHAPLGSKSCHYERQISVMLRDQRTGELLKASPLDEMPGSRGVGPDGRSLPVVLEIHMRWLRVQEK